MEIKELRESLGLSKAQFGRRLGVAQITVRRWENGSHHPSPIVRKAIKEIFGVEIKKGGLKMTYQHRCPNCGRYHPCNGRGEQHEIQCPVNLRWYTIITGRAGRQISSVLQVK